MSAITLALCAVGCGRQAVVTVMPPRESDNPTMVHLEDMEGIRQIPLPPTPIRVYDAQGKCEELRVILEETRFAAYETPAGNTNKSRLPLKVLRYVLRPRDTSLSKWEWAAWTANHPFESFALSRDGDTAHLAWVVMGNVWFADVTHPRSAEANLQRDLALGVPEGTIRVPVRRAAGERAFPSLGDRFDITPLSVHRDETGKYLVQVAGKGGKVFTFVGDGIHWRLK